MIPAAARAALDHAWIEVLRNRHPEFHWTLLRPRERGQRSTPTPAGEIVGGLTSPENEDAFLERNGATRTSNGPNHHSIDSCGD
jgi:hypothetical protein